MLCFSFQLSQDGIALDLASPYYEKCETYLVHVSLNLCKLFKTTNKQCPTKIPKGGGVFS